MLVEPLAYGLGDFETHDDVHLYFADDALFTYPFALYLNPKSTTFKYLCGFLWNGKTLTVHRHLYVPMRRHATECTICVDDAKAVRFDEMNFTFGGGG